MLFRGIGQRVAVLFPLVFFLVPNHVIAAEIRCDRHAAKTFYKSSSSASKTEDRDGCRISIDGASPPSDLQRRAANLASFCFLRLSKGDLWDIDKVGFIEVFVPILLGPTVPGYQPKGHFPFETSEINCKNAVEDMTLSSNIHDSISHISQELSACINDGDGSGLEECNTGDGTKVIVFSTEFGTHELRIPNRK